MTKQTHVLDHPLPGGARALSDVVRAPARLARRLSQVGVVGSTEEALALPADQLVGAQEALPPLKVHCAQLVEGALRAALVVPG